jgi:hypothetical protein
VSAKVREGWTAAEAVKWADAEEERREATEAAMDAVIGEQRHVFVPLGFEANGAYGAATRDFFRVIERAVARLSNAWFCHKVIETRLTIFPFSS